MAREVHTSSNVNGACEAPDLVATVCRRIGTQIRDTGLLRQALRHRSAVPAEPYASYERLEFLGDAVLSFAICNWLYRSFPGLSEGDMAKRRAYLASEAVLAEVAQGLGLDELILVAQTLNADGERRRTSIQADVVEALIGAVYLDSGIRSAQAMVRRLLKPAMKRVSKGAFESDCKTRLQELTQARWGVLPVYAMPPPAGEPHCPTFTAIVSLGGRVLGTGRGPSKKAAQQEAARAALVTLDSERDSDDRSTH